MRIISMRSDLFRRLCAVVLLLALQPLHAAVNAVIGSEGHLLISSNHGRALAYLSMHAKRDIHLNPPLAHDIGAAQDFFAVGKKIFTQDGISWLLLVTQTASRDDHAAGACGSGTEDVLHLVQVDLAQARLVERSNLLLQSCLTGLSLNDDSGHSLREAMESVPNPAHFRLVWLNHPDYGSNPKTLSFVNGAIKME